MLQNPLIKMLSGLTKKEMTRFREFAFSPYFNKHKDVRNLVDYLSTIYPDFTEKKCRREVLLSRLFPTLPHRWQDLSVVFTYTNRLLGQFLTVEQWRKEANPDDNLLLIRTLRLRGQFSFFEKTGAGKAGGGKNKKTTPQPDEGIWDSLFAERKFRLAAEMPAPCNFPGTTITIWLKSSIGSTPGSCRKN
jgi:hypothetical protein